MRELTMDELEEVSGGNVAEALGLWGAAAYIGNSAYGGTWATIGLMTAAGISPIVALGMVGLALGGGYVLLRD